MPANPCPSYSTILLSLSISLVPGWTLAGATENTGLSATTGDIQGDIPGDIPSVDYADLRWLLSLEETKRKAQLPGDVESSAALLLPIWEPGTSSWFGQQSWQRKHLKQTMNLGLGYRFLPWQWVLLGANVFYDRLEATGAERVSVGAEAKGKVLDFYVNWYQGLAGSIDSEYQWPEYNENGGSWGNGSGWDMEIAGRLPQFPWVELAGQYYQWNPNAFEADEKYAQRQSYRLSLTPLPLFSLQLAYEDPQPGNQDWGLQAQLLYRFGTPWTEQLRLRSAKTGEELLLRRFEQVRRRYDEPDPGPQEADPAETQPKPQG